MANNAELNGWTKVINAVKTPLSLLTLLALILYSVFLFKAQTTENVSMGLLILLGLLIVLIFVLVFKKTLQENHTRVNVRFPGLTVGKVSGFDFEDCALEIRDGKSLRRCYVNPTPGYDGQAITFLLIENVGPTASVRLDLKLRNWKVPPFNPNNINLEAEKV